MIPVSSRPSISLGGPVSTALEADLRTTVRQQGVVVWLDGEGQYTGFVDRLKGVRSEGNLPYEVHAYRGSHLALMLSLEGVAGGVDRPRMVLHLPGFNEETVRDTPFLELYAAGVRYRKALDTLVSEAAAGRVAPEELATFKARPGLTLDSADTWLASRLGETGGGIAGVLREMSLAELLDDLLGGKSVSKRVENPEDVEALWQDLSMRLGLPPAWRQLTLGSSSPRAGDVAYVAASWALAVEYVDDLRRPPVNDPLKTARGMPRALIDAGRALAAHLRGQHADFYQRTADTTELLLADEVEAAQAEDLGRIDTFRFEEDKVFLAALAALERADWNVAADWVAMRVDAGAGTSSFWLRRDLTRSATWQRIGEVARLGQALTAAGGRLGVGPDATDGLESALEAYLKRGVAVDRAHRVLEQSRVTLLYSPVPEFARLRACLDSARRAWREWADAWARDFNALCRVNGFLPAAGLQQRTLFDDVVRPMTQESGTTAYFVVDALRYEMGEELFREIEATPATTVHLKARLAELPTVTEVGMNVLAPVGNGGRLTPVLSPDGSRVLGFQSGEFRVSDPDSRRRAMQDRVGGSTCPWLTLEEVVNRDSTSLRQAVARARLLVVHSREIDIAGETGNGPALFGQVMQKLRVAWQLLREAGVRRFVFTGDHGFLLLDESTGAAQAHGRRIDPKRRHVFSTVPADHTGEVRVPLAELGYEGATGHVLFPETTAVFQGLAASTGFVHGGNSLQERVIPVLTVVHRAAAGGSTLQYRVAGEIREGVAGLHCVAAWVEVVAQEGLDFGRTAEVEVALRVKEVPGVQVELCHVRGQARLGNGVVLATVGEHFELFFRLTGPSDARVPVELHHPGVIAVMPWTPDHRFAVTAGQGLRSGAAPMAAEVGLAWLDQFEDRGVRRVFEHLAAHGTVTEDEVAGMLGGPRAARRFAVGFELHAAKAPFVVRIADVGGVKRYMKEGVG
jgi:hypothetical protein